ncbi:MAG: hypothetical protein K2Q20_01845 [Phycisphaerales bacterium]|nr:hypothetical protein [Phycisphaerales bacterium]
MTRTSAIISILMIVPLAPLTGCATSLSPDDTDQQWESVMRRQFPRGLDRAEVDRRAVRLGFQPLPPEARAVWRSPMAPPPVANSGQRQVVPLAELLPAQSADASRPVRYIVYERSRFSAPNETKSRTVEFSYTPALKLRGISVGGLSPNVYTWHWVYSGFTLDDASSDQRGVN